MDRLWRLVEDASVAEGIDRLKRQVACRIVYSVDARLYKARTCCKGVLDRAANNGTNYCSGFNRMIACVAVINHDAGPASASASAHVGAGKFGEFPE